MSSSFIDAADAASKPDQSLLFPVYGILGVAEHPIAYMKGLGSSILRSISDSTPREDPQKAHKELIWKKRGTLDGGFWAKESYPPLPGKAEVDFTLLFTLLALKQLRSG